MTMRATAARSRGHVAAAAVVAALVLVSAGCSSGTSSKSEPATTTIPKDFAVTLPDGQVTVSLTGKLPPGWPSDFPLPPGTSPAGSGSLRRADETAMVAVFSTAERPSDAFAFYTGNTQLQGSNARSVGVGSSFAGTMKFSGELEGSLSVLGREKTYIVVALSSSTSGTTV